jgi:hypothetical protein
VPPGRPDLLSQAMAYLLQNPQEAQRMAANAYALLDRRCQPEILGLELERTYVRSGARRG